MDAHEYFNKLCGKAVRVGDIAGVLVKIETVQDFRDSMTVDLRFKFFKVPMTEGRPGLADRPALQENFHCLPDSHAVMPGSGV